MTLTRSIPANAASRLRAAMEQADSEEGAVAAALALVDSWDRSPEGNQAAVADGVVSALCQAWADHLHPGGPLDPKRRHAVLAIYVGWAAEALGLQCARCGSDDLIVGADAS